MRVVLENNSIQPTVEIKVVGNRLCIALTLRDEHGNYINSSMDSMPLKELKESLMKTIITE